MSGLHEDLIDLIKQHGAAKLIKRLYIAVKDEQDMRDTTKIEDVCLDILGQCDRVIKREEKAEAKRQEEDEE